MKCIFRFGMIRAYYGWMWWRTVQAQWEQRVIQFHWYWRKPIFIPLSKRREVKR